MRPLPTTTLLGGLALVLSGVSVVANSQQLESQPTAKIVATSTGASAPARDGFAGVWVYNAEESLNAANGRKEDPATMRRVGNSGTSGRTGAGGSGGGGGRSGGGGGGSLGGANSGGGNSGYPGGGFGGGGASPFTPLIANERRDLVRDLLEVPVELTIKLTEEDVTFVDHLARALTFPTTGKKKKYQLSASVFEAKAYWEGAHFNKEIEGADGFKLRETYFLSENSQRLFVVLRIGTPTEKDAPVQGVNRIYDRVQR